MKLKLRKLMRNKKILAALFIAIILFTSTAFADGTLDSGFGTNGLVTLNFGGFEDNAQAVAVQADGKIVTAGFSDNGSYNTYAIARHNADGTLDGTFGNLGILNFTIGTNPTSPNSSASSIAIQPDGKILIGGASQQPGPNNSYGSDFTLIRLNTDGTFDTSFGVTNNGIALADFTTGNFQTNDQISSLALQPDGKIVVAGDTGVNRDFAVARFNSNGSLDSSFGTNGKVQTPIGITNEVIYALKLQTDGKIVAAGYSQNPGNFSDCTIVRYNADGSLDTGFGVGGKVITNVSSGNFVNSDILYGLAIQPDGKIIAVGDSKDNSTSNFVVIRYNPTGALDSGFGTNGITQTPLGTSAGFGIGSAYSVALLPTGKIIASGIGDLGASGFGFAVARYNANGALDTNFGTNGIFSFDFFGNGRDYAAASVLQPDGKLILAGRAYAGNSSDTSFGIARLNFAFAPTAANVSVGGQVLATKGQGISNVRISMTDSSGATRTATTNSFGFYHFSEVAAGATYVLTANSKRYSFDQPTQIVSVSDNISDLNFIAN
jgi:uncharacterized delta-60 repeat protein